MKEKIKKVILSLTISIILFSNVSSIISFATTEEQNLEQTLENIQTEETIKEDNNFKQNENQESTTEDFTEEVTNNADNGIALTSITGQQTIKDGYYQILPRQNKNLALTVAGNSIEDKANVNVQTNTKGYNQIFKITYVNGYYFIRPVHSYKSLDLLNGGNSIGTNIQQNTFNKNENQRWVIEKSNDGYHYNIFSVIDNPATLSLYKTDRIALNLENSNAQNGTNVSIYIFNKNSPYQQFEFVETKICDEIKNNIRYVKASFFDYNPDEFNSRARNVTLSNFNNLSLSRKQEIDRTHTLFQMIHTPTISYAGWQNGYNSSNTAISPKGASQGIIGDKLVNNNIVLNYPNANDTVFFPTEAQAENKGLVGDGKPYQEILRNYDFPFVEEDTGYYSFNSNLYHIKKSTSKKSFDLHRGKVGGALDSGNGKNTRYLGFYPFNEDCYINSTPTQANNLGFGIRFNVDFFMTKDGKARNKQTGQLEDMIFNFSGDDDVWVFIDDTLALDIGGGHGAVTGNINFATNTSYVANVTDHATLDTSKPVTKENLFGSSRLKEGNHTLTLFYMERFGGTSNLITTFNLPENKKDLTGTINIKDDNNSQKLRPKQYTIKLYGDGKYLQEKVVNITNNNSTTYSFNDLKEYDEITGNEINYTISVYDVPLSNGDKYVATKSNLNAYLTLTGQTNITVKKVWEDEDNKYNTRPSNITVQFSNSNTGTITQNDNWEKTFTFTKYNSNGKLLTYDIQEEIDVPKGYTKNIVKENDKTVITNTYKVTKAKYKVEYYYNGKIDNNLTFNGTAELGNIISSYEEKPKENYTFYKIENKDLEITSDEENNVIKVYYVSMPLTGGTGTNNFIIGGFILFVFGITIFIIGKKNK